VSNRQYFLRVPIICGASKSPLPIFKNAGVGCLVIARGISKPEKQRRDFKRMVKLPVSR
jgi:hypothetical protein